MCDTINKELIDVGYAKNERESVKIHATLMNAKFASERDKVKLIELIIDLKLKKFSVFFFRSQNRSMRARFCENLEIMILVRFAFQSCAA